MTGMVFSLRCIAIALFGVVTLFAYGAHITHAQTAADEKQHREPILIPDVQEPEEMRVEPFPMHVPNEQVRLLEPAMNRGNNQDPAATLQALNHILEEHPDLSDGYLLRLETLCKGNDRAAILSDINNAIKYASNSLVKKDSSGSLLSMRAKIAHTNGDDAHAMDDLEKAILSNLDDAISFANGSSVTPSKSSSACTWNAADMDVLVKSFPKDYRSHIYRGLYYGYFAFFEQAKLPDFMHTKAMPESLKRAFESLDKAATLNPRSALPHFFKAQSFYKTYSLRMMSVYDPMHDELNKTMLDLLNNTLAIDPNMVEALKERALVYSHLKKWRAGIADYDHVLKLKPNDYAALNDGGMAKMQLGRTYAAISDFSKAIENTERKLQDTNSLEARAEAYMKTQQWALAIKDLTDAISLQLGGMVMLMNINQFRTLYPEYKTASEESIARKLNQTFYPQMKYEGFSKRFLNENIMNSFWPSAPIIDLYLKRSDAYLKLGNWIRAAVDFKRALNAFPDYVNAGDRWHEVGSNGNTHAYIDLNTFDDSHNDSVKFWIKISQQSGGIDAPYSLHNYELNCVAKRLRTVSFMDYNASGDVIRSHEGGEWEGIVPDTFGEKYLNSICRSS